MNLYIHEYGHYTVANYYGLNPETHFESITISSDSKINPYTPAAYTSYTSNSRELTTQDAAIAFAGPLVNLIFALIVCAAYLALPKQKRTFWVQTSFAILAVPAFISFIINLLPLGFSDGAIILNALL